MSHAHDTDTAYDGTCKNCLSTDIAGLLRAAYRRGWDDGFQGEPFGANFITEDEREAQQ
jgi:hypothetical protein